MPSRDTNIETKRPQNINIKPKDLNSIATRFAVYFSRDFQVFKQYCCHSSDTTTIKSNQINHI